MPSFNRDALLKGSKAIDDAVEARKQGGGEFTPFLSNIYWKSDKDFRYLLFLNPIEEIPRTEFHPYIDTDEGFPEMIMARTDPSIGERTDPIHDQWGYKPRLTNLAIAVELEPTMTIVKGYEKPTGFEVATRTFERRVRNDKGELTDEREEVTVPLVGLVAQSPYNFFNQLRAYDATENAVHATPLKITRLGEKTDLTYNVVGYEVAIDRSGLLDYWQNLNYINADDILSLEDETAGKDDEEASLVIGDYLLYRRIEELANVDNYNAILSKITKPAKFADTKKEKAKPVRQVRPSQRRKEDVEAPVSKVSSAAERLEQLKKKGQGVVESA
jgi:hypothetical protein